MAIKIYDRYTPRAIPADANYPQGSIKNESTPGANDGTPLEKDWGNDISGFHQKLLLEGGVTPSGTPDTVLASDYYDSLQNVLMRSGGKPFATVAALKADTTVKVGDFVTIESYTSTNNSGVMFGKIVAGGTGTDDGGSYIDLPSSGLQFKQIFGDELTLQKFNGESLSSPFGKTGMRVLLGSKQDAYYSFGSVCEIPNSNKWVMIYRKGNQHAIEDGVELRAADSYDFGDSWVNDRLLYTNPSSDARPDKIAVMANGRIGFFVNRQDEGATHFSPLFFKSDDGGVTFTSSAQTTSSPYTFASVGGIIDFPTSQGGNDSTGFLTFGTLNAGTGIDYFYTTDNGDTWSIGYDAGVPSGAIERISENVSVRLGDSDRWLMFCRAESVGGGWHDQLSVFATTNLLDWGAPLDAGVENKGTPPAAFYDDKTDKVYYVGTARAGSELAGVENNFVIVGEDANTLWSNQGVFADDYSVLCAMPHWAVGYLYTFKSKGRLMGAFSCAEPQANTTPSSSAMMLIGDFYSTGADASLVQDLFIKRQYDVKSIGMRAKDNDTTTQPLSIENRSKSASFKMGVYSDDREMGGSDFNSTVTNCPNVNISYSTNLTVTAGGIITWGSDNHLFGGLTSQIDGETAAVHLGVQGSTFPAARSFNDGTAARKHFIFHNGNGEVGNITTTGTSTSFNTTSDETLKEFTGEYSGAEALKIIARDPVRDFTWKNSGESAVGWGAQTSYSVSPDLASKGGWFLNDEEVAEGTEGAVYVPWGVDHSKRTPYLWAAVSELSDKIKQLRAELNALRKL